MIRGSHSAADLDLGNRCSIHLSYGGKNHDTGSSSPAVLPADSRAEFTLEGLLLEVSLSAHKGQRANPPKPATLFLGARAVGMVALAGSVKTVPDFC